MNTLLRSMGFSSLLALTACEATNQLPVVTAGTFAHTAPGAANLSSSSFRRVAVIELETRSCPPNTMGVFRVPLLLSDNPPEGSPDHWTPRAQVELVDGIIQHYYSMGMRSDEIRTLMAHAIYAIDGGVYSVQLSSLWRFQEYPPSGQLVSASTACTRP